MEEVEVVLVTGRTIKQGMGVGQGKQSDLYLQETAAAEFNAETLACLQVDEGDEVLITTEFGQDVFKARKGDLPPQIAFLPYGARANTLTGAVTEGSGMPAFKGLKARVRRCQE